jgi:hypothetical protein
MRNITIASCIGLLLCSGPGLAAQDVMAGYYGNTSVSKGRWFASRTHYRPDHSFDQTLSGFGMSRSFKGTWQIDTGGQLCRTYIGKAPPGMKGSVCMPIAPRHVGDAWIVTSNGDTREFTLEAGVR